MSPMTLFPSDGSNTGSLVGSVGIPLDLISSNQLLNCLSKIFICVVYLFQCDLRNVKLLTNKDFSFLLRLFETLKKRVKWTNRL